MIYVDDFEKMKQSKNLLVWGKGSYSVEVQRVLTENEISYIGFYINIENIVLGENEYSLDDIITKFGSVDLVLGHGHSEKIKELDEKIFNNIFLISNPYKQYQLKSYDVEKLVERIKGKVDDSISKEAIDLFYAVQTDGIKLLDLINAYDKVCTGTMFNIDIIKNNRLRNYIDIGAFNGDSVKEYLAAVGEYDSIWAIEPEPDSYVQLCENTKQLHNIKCINAGVGAEIGTLYIEPTKNAQSTKLVKSCQKDAKEIKIDTLDSLLLNECRFNLIKIAVPFMARQIIMGGSEYIKKYKPVLIVNIALSCNEIEEILSLIREINDDYNFRFRFDFPMPTRLIMYAY